MMLHAGINLLHLVPNETGGGELYARRLIPALLSLPAPPRLTLFAAGDAVVSLRCEPWAEDVRLEALPFDPRSRVRRVVAEQTLLPVSARRSRIDLLHNVFTTAPAIPAAPQVTTILDVIYERFPQTHSGARALGMRSLVPLAARRSRRVLTLSEASKRDIVGLLGVDPGRVDVTYLGPGMPDDVEPVPERTLRDRFELGELPILLTVSAKRPHKNLDRLFEAVARLDRPMVLVVPGYETPFEPELRTRAEAVAPGRIRFTGWIDDAELEGLYRAATALVFPSLAEGFGLPVLEAMIRGLPVACSNTSSLPEIARDAAAYFDPYDVGAIVDAIDSLLADADLRSRLREAGFRQAAKFRWSDTARATMRSYERALDVAPTA
jgi:glycosyltransferase involved in cell wall biosynthesis